MVSLLLPTVLVVIYSADEIICWPEPALSFLTIKKPRRYSQPGEKERQNDKLKGVLGE
jgi:hypothetical protein